MRLRPSSWLAPAEVPSLSRAEVHVWRANLHLDTPRVEALENILSPEERYRAERFRFEVDRLRYKTAHGLLREILARYLAVLPASLTFVQGAHGKPSLTAYEGRRTLRFNLSHSENMALIAVAIDREVGVDVESVRRHVEAVEIARRFFSAEEAAALAELQSGRRNRAFFELWTRKEAVLKAIGMGIAAGSSALQQAGGKHPDFLQWRVRSLEPAPGYLGAVAAEGWDWLMRCWTAP